MSLSITFGTPKGSARMTCVAVVVPTAPAHEMIPSQLPGRVQLQDLAAPARPDEVDGRRARGGEDLLGVVPVAARTSSSEMSAQSTAPPRLRSMISGLPPCAATCSARNRISTPFVLHIPVTTIVGASLTGTSWGGPVRRPASDGSLLLPASMMALRRPSHLPPALRWRAPRRPGRRAGILRACA